MSTIEKRMILPFFGLYSHFNQNIDATNEILFRDKSSSHKTLNFEKPNTLKHMNVKFSKGPSASLVHKSEDIEKSMGRIKKA